VWRAIAILFLALVLTGCEPERSFRWEDPLAGAFSVRGYVRDQHGSGVDAVELKLTAPDGTEYVGFTRRVAPEDHGWFATLFFGPPGQYRLAIVSLPYGYSVPETQSNPVTFQLDASTSDAYRELRLHRD
jgi:hypothetical protein